MKSPIRILFALVLISLFSIVYAEEPKKESKKSALPEQFTSSDKPIQIDADNMIVYRKENKIVFTGRVVMRQEPTVINSNKLTAFYAEKNMEIKTAICEGNVRITHEKTFAKCGKATFDNVNRVVLMEISPIIYQENHVFRGKILKYFLEIDQITGVDVRYQRNPTPAAVPPKGP